MSVNPASRKGALQLRAHLGMAAVGGEKPPERVPGWLSLLLAGLKE